MDVLKWQGAIPDDNKIAVLEGQEVDNVEGGDAKNSSWEQYDEFSYLKPKFEISSLF